MKFNIERYCKKFLEKGLLVLEKEKRRKEKEYGFLFRIRNQILEKSKFSDLNFRYRISELPTNIFPNKNSLENSDRKGFLEHYLKRKSRETIRFIRLGKEKRSEKLFQNLTTTEKQKQNIRVIRFSSKNFWLVCWNSELNNKNSEISENIIKGEVLDFLFLFIDFLEKQQKLSVLKQKLILLLLEKCPFDNMLIINKKNKKQIFFNRSKIFRNEISVILFLKHYQFENDLHKPDFLMLTSNEENYQNERKFSLKEFFCADIREFIHNDLFFCPNNKFLMKKMLETHNKIIFRKEIQNSTNKIIFFRETGFHSVREHNLSNRFSLSLKNLSSAVFYNNVSDLIHEKNMNVIKNEPTVFYFYNERIQEKEKEISVIQFLIPMRKRTENENKMVITISHSQQSFFPGPSTIVITKEKNIEDFICEFWYNGVRITEEEMIEKISGSQQNKDLTKFIMGYFI